MVNQNYCGIGNHDKLTSFSGSKKEDDDLPKVLEKEEMEF
jgi:hypothetical protein